MEGYQQSSLKMCQNCSKSFPQQKIDLHEAYCRRNIKKCILCFQMYDVNQQQAHDKQFHSKKECRYCHCFLTEKQLDSHQPSCKKRPVSCQFCQNQIAYQQVLKHEESCGSRTVRCQVCRKYIALRQIDVHKATCIQRAPPTRNEHPPRNPSRDQLRQNIRDYPLGQPFSLHRVRSNEQRIVRPDRLQNNDREQIINYQDPPRLHRQSNQRNHVVSTQKQKTNLNMNKQPAIRIQVNVKPSHIIQPEKMRQVVDPVPISIRIAMAKTNKKTPLQNRN